VRPALDEPLVHEAELEQVVIGHHPVNARDARQMGQVRVLEVRQ
jgi:hypothetical protein